MIGRHPIDNKLFDEVFKCPGLTKYAVHNKFRVLNVINYHFARAGKCLPSGIQVMNEDNEYNRSFDRANRHHEVSIFGMVFGPEKASLAREDLTTRI